ncbi:ABC transporter ATP-binding protein [Streptococcus catagoni]|uniref:ABC transporter ATP-binding protein n=1 Tax=Streptococcus catagoni TaxID=2654874 RepID=UPI00140CFAD8|nr:ABC transporter ATP-binding protein [Streptococcus catagoni]
MKAKIQNYFSLTDQGINNVFKAAFWSLLKFISFMFPVILVFSFLQDMLSHQLKGLQLYLAILLGISCLIFLILYREYGLNYDVTYKESVRLRINLADKIRALPLSYFSKHNLTDLSQTIMMDVNNIEMTISHALAQSMGFIGFLVLVTFLLLWNNLSLGLTVVGPIWLTLLIMLLTRNLQTYLISQYYQRLLENADAFQEAFELQKEIKSYSLQESTEKELLKKLSDTEKIHFTSDMPMAVLSTLISLLPYLAPVLTATVGVDLLHSHQITLLYYIGYLMAATALATQYGILSDFLKMIFYFKDSFKRVRDLYAQPVQEGQDYQLENYDFTCQGVHFAYGDQEVIRDLTFTAKQGQVTALVGPSGCGKTTVLRLLSRLYDYDSGLISLGGVDIKKMDTACLYDKISIVFQETELFNTSILENIRVGRKSASDEEVLRAAKLANVDKIVENLPERYQTVIGENGSKLSGGERQRISIARAFLKDAPVILLDEISASIDVENEMAIQKSISRLIKDKTVITVSHRLKSIENADQIIVLDQGQVESLGQHQELMKLSPIYQTMLAKTHKTENFVY